MTQEKKHTANPPPRPDMTFLDVMQDGEKTAFVWLDPGGKLVAAEDYAGCIPFPKGQLGYAPVDLKTLEKLLENPEPPEKLAQDFMKYLAGHSPHPLEQTHVLDLAWVAHTYWLERFDTTPYRNLESEEEGSGKNLRGSLLLHAAYRGRMFTAPKEAQAVHFPLERHITMGVSYEDAEREIERAKLQPLFLEGSSRLSGPVVRIEHPFEEIVREYDPFIAKLILTNQPLRRYLRSRCICTYMEEYQGRLPRLDPEELHRFRTRFMASKVVSLKARCAPVEPYEFSGRIGDKYHPLIAAVELLDIRGVLGLVPTLREMAQRETEEHQDTLASSQRAALTEVVGKAYKRKSAPGPLMSQDIHTIWQGEKATIYGTMSTNSLGRYLADLPFLSKGRGSRTSGGRGWLVDEPMLIRFHERYRLSWPPDSSDGSRPAQDFQVPSSWELETSDV